MPPSAVPSSSKDDRKKRQPRDALEPITGSSSSAASSSSASVGSKARGFFGSGQDQSTKILTDLAPMLMKPGMLENAANSSLSRPTNALRRTPTKLDLSLLRLSLNPRRISSTSTELRALEDAEDLLPLPIPSPIETNPVSLLRGFQATIPSAREGKAKRRKKRLAEDAVGLKQIAMGERGLLTDGSDSAPKKEKGRRRKTGTVAKRELSREELLQENDEILADRENVHVRRSLINSEISEVDRKIEALRVIRKGLEDDLLRLQEEELELEDELEGVNELLSVHDRKAPALGRSSRRKRAAAFLPSDHDDLPHGVAFMTLHAHSAPVTALDFSEPYGTLVTAGADDVVRVWELSSGEEIGRLRGHQGPVKCIQIEDEICLTGGADGNIRLWDLRQVEAHEAALARDAPIPATPAAAEAAESDPAKPNSVVRQGGDISNAPDADGPCTRVLEGHTKAVTSMYFEEACLVTGASDKTLRQWDLTTGQCVLTMDILWAISHPPPAPTTASSLSRSYSIDDFAPSTVSSYYEKPARGDLMTGTFAVPTPPYSDGSWEMYQDFVGGVQFWAHALVSGSGDGGVRMWDMRTGQAHRTLLGHTGPVTCLQFDEFHVVSGSLDKSVRIWDLRTGQIFDTLKFEHPVTAVQFDTRKIVAAAGDNTVKIYNRTSLQTSSLTTNGHIKPVERLRYMDTYLVSGGKDGEVRCWAL